MPGGAPATGGDWFPDMLAAWYDAIAPYRRGLQVAKWRRTRPALIDDWASELLSDPHGAAAMIRAQISAEPDVNLRLERTFQALLASSSAIDKAGIVRVRSYGGPGWTAIRRHWAKHGNLLAHAPGFVLPRRSRRFFWQGNRPAVKSYHDAGIFEGFLRVAAPQDPVVAIRTMNHYPPEEMLDDGLRIAVVPLVHSMSELRFEHIDREAERLFRVAPASPERVVARAMRAILRCGRLGCDVVLMPELCLTPEGQERLKEVAAISAKRFNGRPWLTVAATSHAPADGGGFHNRAIVLGPSGDELLTHNKLFPYEISRREQTRYGIAEALRTEPRLEDIVVEPRRLEILECPLGRAAILICEDLANLDVFAPIIRAFEIDWLLVPVMDGVQNLDRWTAKSAHLFAEQYGTSVLVGTCSALVNAHREAMKAPAAADPGSACGLLARRQGWDTIVHQLRLAHEADTATIFHIK